MTRSRKLIMLLVVLAAAICVFFIVSHFSTSYTESQTSNATELFTMESTDDAISLSWEYDGENYSFSKTDDEWVYDYDDAFPADQDEIVSLLYNLVSVESSKTIESPEDTAQYGLDEPTVVVSVSTSENEITMEFGDATSITGEYYCSIGDGNVYLVSSTIADSFEIDLISIVEMEEIPSMDDTNSLTVTTADATYEFEHIEDSGIYYSDEYVWFYDDDGEYVTLDNELFDSYLSEAIDISFISCVTYNASDEELEEYGLNDPSISFSVNYTRTEEVETDETDEDGNIIYETNTYIEDFELEIGEYDDDYCYARIPGSSMVYLVDASIKDSYTYTDIDSLLPDDVIKLDWYELTGFEAVIDGETYIVDHEMVPSDDEDDDTVTSEYTYEGEEVYVASVLNSLYNLSSSGTASGSDTSSGAVLAFTFYRDHENYPEITLEFYRYDSSTYFVVFNGEATVLVSSSSVDTIAENLIEALTEEDEEETEETSAS